MAVKSQTHNNWLLKNVATPQKLQKNAVISLHTIQRENGVFTLKKSTLLCRMKHSILARTHFLFDKIAAHVKKQIPISLDHFRIIYRNIFAFRCVVLLKYRKWQQPSSFTAVVVTSTLMSLHLHTWQGVLFETK